MTTHIHSDCRSPEGITIGLIDGIIAMARVLRHRDGSSEEVQEALKDLRGDEDMAWLMGNSQVRIKLSPEYDDVAKKLTGEEIAKQVAETEKIIGGGR